MQDRFRFRVWNKEEKEMIYNAEYAYDGMNYNTENLIGKNTNDGHIRCIGHYFEDEHNPYEIMQCTGLKDRNGKLIYEGDVVRCYWNPITYDISSIFEWIVPVEWDKEWACWGLFLKKEKFVKQLKLFEEMQTNEIKVSLGNVINTRTDFEYACGVIGNIYENPELLEENTNDERTK